MSPVFKLFSIFFFLSCFTANAQYSITGKITDNKNIPVNEAEIYYSAGSLAKSNSSGEYKIEDLKRGNYKLTITKQGFKSVSKKIEIKDKNVELDFALDSLVIRLKEITVKTESDNSFGISRLNNVEGTLIYAGKKNEVIELNDVSANLSTNNSRQIYSKIPGLNIWESDGAGLQLGIGGRGLSPNRVTNFNTRQNGYDISADALGYPDAYYIPPAEALERIEMVRGAASLQYGTQFGGMVNFKMKKGIEDKKIQLVSRNTIGSFNFYNTSNSIGGTVKKLNYYIFHQYKKGDGWRPNSRFNSNTAFGGLTFNANEKLTLTLEYTFMDYLAQQPGGLTDKMFEDDPLQSIRDRNWFKVNWNLAALIVDYKINERTTFNMKNFGLLAGRDALGFQGAINRGDPMTERNLLKDKYSNFGNETRLLHRYKVLDKNAIIAGGVRYYKGFTDRKQGNGPAGSDADFNYLNPDNLEHSDYDFPSENIAVFTENIFYILPNFTVTPGLRYEHINTASEGYYRETNRDFAGNIIFDMKIEDNRSNKRDFILSGIGLSYKRSEGIELYGNISQNYRAINFNDMRVVNPNSKVDPDLKDERGFSSDIGIRGNMKQMFNYDLSVFLINYKARIGSVIKVDPELYNTYRLRTNISDSRNYGVESFFELDIFRMIKRDSAKTSLSVFVNFAWLDARYINSEEAAFENKKVELVPDITTKTGISFKTKNFKTSLQYAYTSEHFTDATNAVFTANAVNGIIPAYYVMDYSAEYTFKKFTFITGVNNLTNNYYFTRRADGYPGPGIIPSDGRSFYFTLQVKI